MQELLNYIGGEWKRSSTGQTQSNTNPAHASQVLNTVQVSGETDAFLSEGDPDFFTDLYAESRTACGFSSSSTNHLIVRIPMVPGEYPFSLSGHNMTFAIAPSSNLIAFNGKVVVDEVTATTVTGGLYGRYNEANEVNGTFTATICPP